MKEHRRKRLYLILFLSLVSATALGLILYAMKQNINLYLTPSQIYNNHSLDHKTIRVGGMVKKGSFKRKANTLHVSFTLTDYQHTVRVKYTGVLPALFREGQGLVVEGKLNKQGVLMASMVLAKHDENYKPPMIHASPERLGESGGNS